MAWNGLGGTGEKNSQFSDKRCSPLIVPLLINHRRSVLSTHPVLGCSKHLQNEGRCECPSDPWVPCWSTGGVSSNAKHQMDACIYQRGCRLGRGIWTVLCIFNVLVSFPHGVLQADRSLSLKWARSSWVPMAIRSLPAFLSSCGSLIIPKAMASPCCTQTHAASAIVPQTMTFIPRAPVEQQRQQRIFKLSFECCSLVDNSRMPTILHSWLSKEQAKCDCAFASAFSDAILQAGCYNLQYFDASIHMPPAPGHVEDLGRSKYYLLWQVTSMSSAIQSTFDQRAHAMTTFPGLTHPITSLLILHQGRAHSQPQASDLSPTSF